MASRSGEAEDVLLIHAEACSKRSNGDPPTFATPSMVGRLHCKVSSVCYLGLIAHSLTKRWIFSFSSLTVYAVEESTSIHFSSITSSQ